MRTSKRTLVYLSALVWYIGGIMLFKGGYELISLSLKMRPGKIWPWIFILAGIILGIVQASTIFTSSCRKNILRISQLQEPRIWQFFRPAFFLALAVMITSGILLDHFSKGNYFYMLGVAALDFALTISLIGSSHIFWTETLPE